MRPAGLAPRGGEAHDVHLAMTNSVIIVGAGIAGLSAGCYLQMNGYETRIFESHKIPGGLCTSWRRKLAGGQGEIWFDGCLHWLAGSGPASPFHQMWSELLDLSSVRFVDHDLRVDIEVDQPDRHGDRVFHLHGRLDLLERYLKDVAPEDGALIDELVAAARTLQRYSLPPLVEVAHELRTWRDKLRLVPYLPFLLHARTWSNTTNFAFAERARSPFLRAGLRTLFEGRELPMLLMTMQLAWFDQRCAGYPIGGSRRFAERIGARYTSLGGTFHYKAPVKRMLVEGGRAVGVELEDGQQHRADTVVSAADGHWTLFDALEGRYVDAATRDLYAGRKLQLFESLVLVSLCVGRTFEREPWLLRFPLAEPVTMADGTRFDRLEAHVYNYDPTLAPAGRTNLSVTLYTRNHAFWTGLREKDPVAYRAAKDEVARQVVDRLDARLGGIKDQVEVLDVATPATIRRYTRNWQGSYEGWFPPDDWLNAKPLSKTLPGLQRFYMIGQWVEPGGGVPVVALSGRNLAQVICARDGKRFEASRCPAAPAQPMAGVAASST
jgi:phytoene dehydrogenase-like protein